MADDGESLESWLNKATNPSNRQEDWEYIMGFCDQINKELEGPQISVRLLAHKIQSPQEWEAIQALTVLEACMKNCGRRFHNEVGKFRFLNELIKVVSPKYLGDKVSEGVKVKVIEMLYSWTVSLPDEAKICEAYQMLKSQGIVLEDPEIPLDATLIPSPSPRPKNPVFDDEKKSKSSYQSAGTSVPADEFDISQNSLIGFLLRAEFGSMFQVLTLHQIVSRLSELLKSKKPEDLQEANRLIKNMVKEDEVRTQRSTKQQITLEAVTNSVKVLNEMLAHFSPEDSTDGDKELIKELYGDCDKLRQTVFQLATETEDNDSSLGDILQASDDLSHVMNSYKKIVERQTFNGETQGTQSVTPGGGRTNQSEILIDLVGLDNQSDSPPELQPPISTLSIPADLLCGSAATQDPHASSPSAPSAALCLLDEELLSLGLNEAAPVPSKTTNVNLNNNLASLQDLGHDLELFDTTSSLAPAFSSSSLLPDALSAPASSAVSSDLSHPVNIFSTPPLSSASFSTTSDIFPQPLASVSITALPAPLPQASGMVLPASSAPPVTSHQLSNSAGGSHSLANSLSHNLQDLALLDLGSPKNLFCDHLHSTPDELDVGSLLVDRKDPHAPADLSSHLGVPSITSASLLLGGMHDGSGLRPSSNQADDSPLLRSLSPVLPLSQPSPSREQDASLANVCVPLDAIKPSQVCPVTAYDRNGVRVLLHFTTNTPPDRPDVLVMVASMLNTAPLPVKNIVLQAAVPKTMKVKLQPPSGTELVPFNPILPPAAITQVILLANPLKEKVRMRYKLTFTLGEQPHTEVGEVNEFPPADRWGNL